MKRYQCIEDCYINGRLFRARGEDEESDEWVVEDGYTCDALKTKFRLIEQFDDPSEVKKPSGENMLRAANSYAKQNKISKAKMDEIVKKAGAKEPHEVMAALVDFVESLAKE